MQQTHRFLWLPCPMVLVAIVATFVAPTTALAVSDTPDRNCEIFKTAVNYEMDRDLQNLASEHAWALPEMIKIGKEFQNGMYPTPGLNVPPSDVCTPAQQEAIDRLWGVQDQVLATIQAKNTQPLQQIDYYGLMMTWNPLEQLKDVAREYFHCTSMSDAQFQAFKDKRRQWLIDNHGPLEAEWATTWNATFNTFGVDAVSVTPGPGVCTPNPWPYPDDGFTHNIMDGDHIIGICNADGEGCTIP